MLSPRQRRESWRGFETPVAGVRRCNRVACYLWIVASPAQCGTALRRSALVRDQPLIILVETVATNRLAAATWARLKVTTNLMQLAARHSTVIALRMIQVIRTLTVRHAIKLLRIDDKLRGIHLRSLVTMPSRLF